MFVSHRHLWSVGCHQLGGRYLGYILDNHPTIYSHIGYALQKFHKTNNGLAQFLYSRDKGMGNKVLLYKRISFFCTVWGVAGTKTIHKLKAIQSRTLHSTSNVSWYKRNALIHSDLKVDSIHTAIKNSPK